MTRFTFALIATLGLASAMASAPLAAQDAVVTGAAEASLPAGTTFNAMKLRGVSVGLGISIASGGSATGQFHAVLQGTSLLGAEQEVVVEGEVRSGSVAADGSATFSGTAAVKVGAAATLSSVPFTATASAGGVKLTLDAAALPTATVTSGSITVRNQ